MSKFDEQETQIIHDLQDNILEGMMLFKQYQEHKMLALEEKVDELQQFSDVSVVKSLTVENAELRSELNVLKRRYQLLETQSQSQRRQQMTEPAAPLPVSLPLPVPKSKPVIKPKKRQAEPEPEPEEEVEVVQPEVEVEVEVDQPEPEVEVEVDQSEPEVQSEPEPQPEVEVEQPEPEEEPEEGLLLVHLLSGHYFLDTVTCELYDFVDETTPGEILGKLKTANIRKKTHYIDTNDNNIYLRSEDGDVGEHVGSRVNGKAVFKKQK